MRCSSKQEQILWGETFHHVPGITPPPSHSKPKPWVAGSAVAFAAVILFNKMPLVNVVISINILKNKINAALRQRENRRPQTSKLPGPCGLILWFDIQRAAYTGGDGRQLAFWEQLISNGSCQQCLTSNYSSSVLSRQMSTASWGKTPSIPLDVYMNVYFVHDLTLH